MIFVYRVTAGQERVVADVLKKKIDKDRHSIMNEDVSILLLVEAPERVSRMNDFSNSQLASKKQMYLDAVSTLEKKLGDLRAKIVGLTGEDLAKAYSTFVSELAPQERELATGAIHKIPVHALAVMDDLRGYIMVEADDEVSVRQAAMRIPHIKGVLHKTMGMDELKDLVEAKPVAFSFNKGDIVELVSGPFKGERARVIKMDEVKEEITVELTEVAVPIPVTIKMGTARLYQKAEDVS